MGISLETLKDTIKERKQDMLNNKALTNELVIDDFMMNLGYNKKRDTSVLRLYDNIIDWKIVYPTGNRIILKTFAFGSNVEVETCEETFNKALEDDTAVVIITNGEDYKVFAKNNFENIYVLINEFNVYDELDAISNKILVSLSKNGFDRATIDDIVMSKYITTDKVKEWLNKYQDNVANIIIDGEQLNDSARLKPLYLEIINKEDSVTEVVTDTEELDKLKEVIEALENEKNAKETEYSNALEQISGLTMQNTSLVAQIEKNNELLGEKDSQIDLLNTEKEELNNTIEQLKLEIKGLNDTSVDKYIQQISDLTEERNCLMEEKELLAEKVKKLQEEIDNLEDVDRKKALELLDIIQVSDDKPRQYVGVVNTELFQYPELGKFVGCVLQKLSEIKGHLAAQYIFDGDMFRLIPNGERKDLIINNKYYDVDVEDMGEEEAINKLRVIFSHFDDLIFECKLVGHLDDDGDIEYTLDKNINRDINADLDKETSGFKINLFKDKEVETEEEPVEEPEVEEPEYIEPQDYLTVVQLQSYFDMFMQEVEDGTVDYTSIKFIGTNNVAFKITETEDLDKLTVKCIDALLAVEAARGRITVIKEFKQFDLREVSDAILKYDGNTKDYPKITAVKYCVHGIESVLQVVQILYNICEQMKIDMSDIFVYANAFTNSMTLVNAFYFDESNIMLYDNLSCVKEDDGTETAVILKGDMINTIIVSLNSLNIHSRILKKATGVKTRYMSQSIASYDDFKHCIELMLSNAINNGIDESLLCTCSTLDGKYKLVSLNESDVSDNNVMIEVEGKTFYVSTIDNWEIPESLIRLHCEIYNDTSIAVKVMVRDNELEFLNRDFYTVEPSLALAVYSFRNYIHSSVFVKQ